MPGETAILHIGSISSWTPRAARRSPGWPNACTRPARLISVDPNIRPMLAGGPVGASLGNDRAAVRARLDLLVAAPTS